MTTWTQLNKSTGTPLTGWFQGSSFTLDGGPFDAYEGAVEDSYIGANYNNTSGAGTISNWLITPSLTVKNGDVVKFYTRTTDLGSTVYPDRLQLRASIGATFTPPTGTGAAGSTSVGSFSTVLIEVNPGLTTVGYPHDWTAYMYTVTGLPAETAVNLAFRYFVTNAGPLGANSDYIGIDSFSVTRPALGVSDLSKNKLSVYPNPTSDYLKINSSEKISSVLVYDLSGKNIPVQFDGQAVNVQPLAKGTYMISIKIGTEVNVQKFIKK
ncbi:MAG: T9SS type A sorting domain-containing protein [Weeksellaceae bacterium]|nr:T9SS type A sorting domain-containing protein [Weeksellaceae bacterium]